MATKACPTCRGTGTITIGFGDRLRELGERQGMTQAQVADLLGVSRPQIANLEAGRSDPTPHMLIVSARVFNVTTDYLLGVEAD